MTATAPNGHDSAFRRSYLVEVGSLVVAPDMLPFLWDGLRRHSSVLERDGVVLRPEQRALIEDARRGAQMHLESSARGHCGHESRSGADMAPASELTTKQVAELLRVGERHLRRIAKDAGVTSAGRNRWTPDQALAIAEWHKEHTP